MTTLMGSLGARSQCPSSPARRQEPSPRGPPPLQLEPTTSIPGITRSARAALLSTPARPMPTHLIRPDRRRPLRSRWSYRRNLDRPTPGLPFPYVDAHDSHNADNTGTWPQAGTNDGQPYYAALDSVNFLWYDSGLDAWFISDTVDALSPPFWTSGLSGTDPRGEYLPQAGADGKINVRFP